MIAVLGALAAAFSVSLIGLVVSLSDDFWGESEA